MSTRPLGPSSWNANASVVASLALQVSGASLGTFPLVIDTASIAFSAFSIQVVHLNLGNNTINLPESATDLKCVAVIMVPPPSNNIEWRHRAVGDQGIPSNRAMWDIQSFDAAYPPSPIQIYAAAPIDGFTLIFI